MAFYPSQKAVLDRLDRALEEKSPKKKVALLLTTLAVIALGVAQLLMQIRMDRIETRLSRIESTTPAK